MLYQSFIKVVVTLLAKVWKMQGNKQEHDEHAFFFPKKIFHNWPVPSQLTVPLEKWKRIWGIHCCFLMLAFSTLIVSSHTSLGKRKPAYLHSLIISIPVIMLIFYTEPIVLVLDAQENKSTNIHKNAILFKWLRFSSTKRSIQHTDTLSF